MPFSFEQFQSTRPYLYHLTARENLPRIKATQSLVCAASLLSAVGETPVIRQKRRGMHSVAIAGTKVCIRDQDPLYRGKMALETGWTFEDFIELLNGHVFFWAGLAHQPVGAGLRHFDRYQGEHPVVLRARFADLVAANKEAGPFFCKYNSGSPRVTYGNPSPRGSQTFVPAQAAAFSPSNVVEVVFRRSVTLPVGTERADGYGGPWQPL
jgi:hypothetical protein